ncbi:TonB-dependent receptor plug domain-containing protein [Flavobacterium sp. RHBU_3]|uniref:TonB-dependent receptor plug domain-containing protein n=1 Tax=Flavobacterium sp. RHBU_3 TaxID=3391184 RepID=UPI003984F2EA
MFKPIHKSLYFSLVVSWGVYAQHPKDTITSAKLDELVITGQFEPQSLKKSVYNVRVITRADIENRAANNLADVLTQYLNITVRPSGADGRSSVSMFGLDGQYFKILIDNIPVVSESGLGNNVDLTQINLDNVERIEIIEGSMGVTHGANAVSGILNIITKKGSAKRWETSASVQEETVGNEYALFNKGRHIQALRVANAINDHWYVAVGANRNDFAGFFDEYKGKDYVDTSNDNLRGYSWLPKEQLTTNALVNYSKGNFRLFYKFEYFHENVDYYNPVVIPIDNYPFPETYYSKDKRYITNRQLHHLNAFGKLLNRYTYNLSASYQNQKRDQEDFNYYILSQQEQANTRYTYQSRDVLYSTGNITNFFTNKRFDMQLGYEVVHEKGFASAASGMFRDDNQQTEDVNKVLANYDVYASAEIKCTERFSLRPGVRYSFQSIFDNQYALSLGSRYLLNHGLEIRASVGKSYRTPNFDELYTYFVDSNHNVQGNAALTPEQSISYEASIKKDTRKESFRLQNNLTAAFINVDDRISLVLASTDPLWQYRYLNIDKYKIVNISSTNQLSYKNFDLSVGASLIGISQQINTAALGTSSPDDYLYSINVNSSVAYRVPKWNTQFAVYYKYTGKYQQFMESTDADNNVTFSKGIVSPYSLLDASIIKSFMSKKLELTLGARNLLDVKNVQSTGSSGTGVHAASGGSLLLAYGTSYFVKLTYNFNFN